MDDAATSWRIVYAASASRTIAPRQPLIPLHLSPPLSSLPTAPSARITSVGSGTTPYAHQPRRAGDGHAICTLSTTTLFILIAAPLAHSRARSRARAHTAHAPHAAPARSHHLPALQRARAHCAHARAPRTATRAPAARVACRQHRLRGPWHARHASSHLHCHLWLSRHAAHLDCMPLRTCRHISITPLAFSSRRAYLHAQRIMDARSNGALA